MPFGVGGAPVAPVQLADREVHLSYTEGARDWVAKHGYDKKFGARPMGRLIDEKIKAELVDELLFGKLEGGGSVKVDVDTKADKLVFELDQLRAAVIPEISYEADWTLPMLQAGAWLEGAHLVSQALGDDPNGAGTALLKQPEVVEYFLRYVQQEGDGRAESAVLDTLKATLGKIKEICSQDAMTADDIKAIHESTGVVLDLLLKRG